ncbi:hypothetical protein AAMO2058_000114000 [Amorphochlora amoebiformis]
MSSLRSGRSSTFARRGGGARRNYGGRGRSKGGGGVRRTIKSTLLHTSALCIIPPARLWPCIQSIRKVHDKAYARWMPHVNLVYPCVAYKDFDAYGKLLEAHCENIKPFVVNLNQVGHFSQRQAWTVHLVPHSQNKGKEWNELHNQCIQALNLLKPEEAKAKRKGFRPHLTIGQFPKSEAPLEVKRLETAFSTPKLEFEVSHLYLISRVSQTAPFRVRTVIPLGGAKGMIKGEDTKLKEKSKGEEKEKDLVEKTLNEKWSIEFTEEEENRNIPPPHPYP